MNMRKQVLSFSNLNFLIRHETDGYVDTNTSILSSNSSEKVDDSLSSMLGSLSLLSANNSSQSTIPPGSKLTVKEEGRIVPLESTLEIKTRVFHKPLGIQEVIPQLWVSQTPNLVRAYHQRGLFQGTEVEDMAAQIKKWEEDNQSDLSRLAALINKILNVVRGCGGNAVLKYDDKADRLALWKVDEKGMLPKDLYSKWDDRDKCEDAGSEDALRPVDRAETEVKDSSMKHLSSTTATSAIRIGDVHYDIEVSKIPYLSSFIAFQAKAEQQSAGIVHGPIALFDVALKGIQSGYRQCFRNLPADLSQHHTLCDTYDFLCVDVLGGKSINEIFADLKSGKSDSELEYKRCREIKGNKSEARDTAFRLLYMIVLGEFKDETKESAKIFNAVLFVVSHSGTFKWRTRSVVRAAYEERFVISTKQRAALDRWEKADTAKLAAEDDVTTGEEISDDYYDSDYFD